MKREQLEKLTKEHNLPDLTGVIRCEEDATLAMVRQALAEKLADYAERLRTIFSPEGVHAITEASVLSERERENAFALHQEIMALIIECELAEIHATDEQDKALIAQVSAVLPSYQTSLIALVAKTKEAYTKTATHSSSLSYLG